MVSRRKKVPHSKRKAQPVKRRKPREQRRKVALLAVYDKTGIELAAQRLIAMGFTLFASSGTAAAIKNAGLPCLEVGDFTKYPTAKLIQRVMRKLEGLKAITLPRGTTLTANTITQVLSGQIGEPILDHRVVTLIWEIYAGLLADKENPDHTIELAAKGVPHIEFVYVSFYPMEKTIAAPDATLQSVREKTDIGGPTLVRAAAKGQRIVVCRREDLDRTLNLMELGTFDEGDLQELVATAEGEVARYCLASANYQGGGLYAGTVGRRIHQLKYGENARQKAALYGAGSGDPLAFSACKLEQGDPGLVNVTDTMRAVEYLVQIIATCEVNTSAIQELYPELEVRGRRPYCAVAVKHGNACGAAIGNNPLKVLIDVVEGDPLAIFGGVVVTNFPIHRVGAEVLIRHAASPTRIMACVVAPDVTPAAYESFKRKEGEVVVLTNPELGNVSRLYMRTAPVMMPLRGSEFAIQDAPTFVLDVSATNLESEVLTAQQVVDMALADAISRRSNSNTIALTRNSRLIGLGVGQMDRAFACQVAVMRAQRAGHVLNGSVAASDSFFPFTDGPEILAEAGVSALFATSGSRRDEAVKEFCMKSGVKFCTLPDAEARGFYAH